jgi:tRNA A37 threonylcarbamoyladenosine biosynthesis protein TsaE
VVEWGEGLADRLADEFLEIQIEFGDSDDQRLVSIVSHGPRFAEFKL